MVFWSVTPLLTLLPPNHQRAAHLLFPCEVVGGLLVGKALQSPGKELERELADCKHQ